MCACECVPKCLKCVQSVKGLVYKLPFLKPSILHRSGMETSEYSQQSSPFHSHPFYFCEWVCKRPINLKLCRRGGNHKSQSGDITVGSCEITEDYTSTHSDVVIKKRKGGGGEECLFCSVLCVAATWDTQLWYLLSTICWRMPTQGRKFYSPAIGLENSLFLGSIKANQFRFGIFNIWGRACRRGRSFLLLHPKQRDHGSQALGKLTLGPTSWPGPWPINLALDTPEPRNAADQPNGLCGYWRKMEGIESRNTPAPLDRLN